MLDRAAAAAAFDLPADRIGDLIVLADAHTVLGRSREAHDLSALHGTAALARRPARADRPDDRLRTRCRDGALGGRELHNRDLHDLLLNAVTV